MADTQPNDPISRLDIPYKNLILTGFLGVGKSMIGQNIVQKLKTEFMDVSDEIEMRETMSIAKLRELYGDSRLKTLEHELCRQAALMRRAVIVVPGAALLDERNYDRLAESGTIVCVTCELGEALRRMHMGSEQHYRDVTIRRRMLSRLRREREIVDDPRILQFDTTHLSVEQECEMLIQLWRTGEPESDHFFYGPPERIKPKARMVVGISAKTVSTTIKR